MKQGYPAKVSELEHIIVVDGVCKLCNRWSRFIIRADRRHIFTLCAMQSPQGQAILKWLDLPGDTFTTMLLLQGNQVLTKSDAFIAIIAQLPAPLSYLAIAKLIPRRARDWIYDRIALNRYKLFGKYRFCVLPSADHPQRFLDS